MDFEGAYAIEGAKEVSTVMTRHVSRLLRPWLASQLQGDGLQASTLCTMRTVLCMLCLMSACVRISSERQSISIPNDKYSMPRQARRRQATDRFKHYLQQAVHTGSHACSWALGSGGSGGGSRKQEAEAAGRKERAEEQRGVALHLRLAPDGRALTLTKASRDASAAV